MKKIFTLLFALGMAYGGFSQTYYTWDFTTITTTNLPTGFVTWNLDGQTVDTNYLSPFFNTAAWVQFPEGGGYTGLAATGTLFFNQNATSNRWLVTPDMTIPTGVPNVCLQWSAFSLDPDYTDNYLVEISTTDSATASFTTTLTTILNENGNAPVTHILPLAAYAGQRVRIAIRDSTVGGFGLGLENIALVNVPSYSIHINDIEIYEHNYLTNAVPVTGLLTNNGFDTINSLVVNYSVNGGATVSSPASSGAGIVPTGISGYEYYYNHPTLFNPSTAGTYNISVWFSQLNGTAAVSDTATITIFYYPKVSGLVKNVLVEEQTGAGCPACSGGALALRDAYNKNSHIIPVAVHSADINDLNISPAADADMMQIADGETMIQTFGAANGGEIFPSAYIDRLYAFDNENSAINLQTADHQYGEYVGAYTYLWDTLAAFRQVQATPVNVTLTDQVVDTIGGTITATVNATYLNSLSQGTYNLNLYVVEDSVLTPSGNNGNGYNQNNGDYSSQSQGTSSISAELYALPAVITDNGQPNNWAQNHVLRTMVGGSWGTTGVIPSAPVADSTYSYTYTTTLSSTWRYNKIFLVGLVQEYNANNVNLRTVLNAVKVPLDLYPTGIVETSEFNKLSVYPNPASTMATVLLDSKENGLVNISVLNAVGQVVIDPIDVLLSTGSQSVNIPVSGLSSGLYFVKVTLNGEVSTLPLSVTSK